jgi:hypothetical protein
MQENNNQIQPLTGNIHCIYISYKEQMVSTNNIFKKGQEYSNARYYTKAAIICSEFITLWLLRIAELQSIRIVEIYSLDAIGKEVSYM